MNKKYQVFISSTYVDLIDERRKILDILLMADCIPAGMEAFVASDLEQFEVIKKVIDLCDYYVLIIGKRYGSINSNTKISYTEMEYNYAKEKGIPVLVFAIGDNVHLPDEKVETDSAKIECLKSFKEEAMSNRLASIWETSADLCGQLAIAIMRAKSEIDRPGWQRAVDFDEIGLRREIMKLKEENEKIKKDLTEEKNKLKQIIEQSNVAFEDYKILIKYHYSDFNKSTYNRKVEVNLKDLFIIIATEMMGVSITEGAIQNIIKKVYCKCEFTVILDDAQLIKRVLNQLKSYGVIRSFWSEKNENLFWSLTSKGEKIRDDEIVIKREI